MSIGICIPTYLILDAILTPHLPEYFITGLEYELHGKHALFASILASVILAPISEEIIFRGLLLPSLQSKFGTTTAVIASSLIFSLIHQYDLTASIAIFIFGVIMALAYLKSQSLVPGMIAHAVFNLWITIDLWIIYFDA